MQIFIMSHYEKVYMLRIMPVIKEKISVDFDPYNETVNVFY